MDDIDYDFFEYLGQIKIWLHHDMSFFFFERNHGMSFGFRDSVGVRLWGSERQVKSGEPAGKRVLFKDWRCVN